MFVFGCSSVEKIKDSTLDTVDNLVPIDLKEKDSSVYGGKDYAEAIVSRVVPKWFKTMFKLSMGTTTSLESTISL